MIRKITALLLVFAALLLFGCAKVQTPADDTAKTTPALSDTASQEKETLADGVYEVDFKTDSSMFKLNETCKGKAKLTVQEGQMTVHITLVSRKILNLFPGTAEDAKKDDAVLLEPTIDKVTYDDGETDEVFGFDVPVPVIGVDFDLAIIGEKGIWYGHKVSVSNPVPFTEPEKTKTILEKGTFEIEVALEGGTGRASIASPTEVYAENGEMYVKIVWSSANYDYMLVNGAKFEPEIIDGHSVFMIPIESVDEPLSVIADTTAMSEPHEIEYTITFDVSTIKQIAD